MKKHWLTFLFVVMIGLLNCNIVINELCYDPAGSDEGYEWIELYNNGNEEVNLIGWNISTGGADFNHDYTFTSIIIRPGRFIVVAEDGVENAHIHTNLDFQNATDAVDGVRLSSPSGDYTDTILYGDANLNNLFDDNQAVGTSFAPDVPQGCSLARIPNGSDTNLCSEDFLTCLNPTPGYCNVREVDLAIKAVDVVVLEDSLKIFTVILNLSTTNVDNSEALLRISIDNTLVSQKELSNVDGLSSINTVSYIEKPENESCILEVEVFHSGELNPVDNLWTTQLLLTPIQLFISELFPAPLTGEQEWIELYNPLKSAIPPSNICLNDWSGNSCLITKTLPPQEYIVLCTDSLALVQKFPECPGAAIIELENIPSLNNSGDGLCLRTVNTLLDSVYYLSSDVVYDCSVIRLEYNSNHLTGLAQPSASSPGQSNPNTPADLHIQATIRETDTLNHSVFINTGNVITDCLFSCTEFDVLLESGTTIYETYLSVSDTLTVSFSTPIPNEGVYDYTYSFQDYALTKRWYQDFLPTVVNEIQYDPLVGKPEWIELFSTQSEICHIQLIISQDTLSLELTGQDYTVITGSANEADELISEYTLNPDQVFTGLPNLNNQGETIRLKCLNGNKEEIFTYNPNWSSTKGVSIERINPYLSPGDHNWSACIDVQGSTPGTENSIFREYTPASSNIELENNPFSPYRNEKLFIKFQLKSASATVDCTVYDLKGRIVAHPARQQIITGDDVIFWNGKSKQGKKVLPGAYLLLIKLEEAGKHTKKQIPIAVGK
ncbi:MAG: lamin tail domain-containing protein [Candidatus Cloacimonetes bacterium]|nr:lamin tail domain-containing protein [Candidatus Cloacimonadota bacterium]